MKNFFKTSYMSYKTRNVLILSVFVTLVVLIGGYFVVYSYPKRINKIKKEIKSVQNQITAAAGVEEEIPKLQELLEVEKVKSTSLNKVVMADVPPSQTYAYLNRILDYSGFIKFDMLYTGTEKSKNFGYNRFSIKGEGTFSSLYRFIWYIERGPFIYKIQRANLRGVEGIDPDTELPSLIVPFDLEIWVLFAEVVNMPPVNRNLHDVSIVKVRNPLYPYIRKNIPPNYEELLEAERAELKALVAGKAMVADHNGRVQMLEEGDEVYLGYVSKINTEKNQVEFTLNKGGIIEQFILKLRFGSENDKEIQ